VDFFVRMQAVVLSFTAGTAGSGAVSAQVVAPVSAYDRAGYVQYDDGFNDDFFDELDDFGSWQEDASYGAVFVPSRSVNDPCYTGVDRFGDWIDRPNQGRVWAPAARFRNKVVAHARPRFVVIRNQSGYHDRDRTYQHDRGDYVRHQRERARLIRYLNELSAREWRRLERTRPTAFERQRLFERQQRRMAVELRRLEMKQARRDHRYIR
jgi:hypothetical protein